MIYMVSYDLGQPNRDYAKLIDKIKAYGTWAKPLKSLWLIKSTSSASQIATDLKAVMDKDDKLVVIEATGNWATVNLGSDVLEWMRNNMK